MRAMSYAAIVAVFIVVASMLAAYQAGLLSSNKTMYLPDVNLNDARMENGSSFKAQFFLVKEYLGISNFSVVVAVNDSVSTWVRFSDEGRATVSDFHNAHNLSLVELVGIEFTVQFFDKDKDGRVTEYDHIIVTCSEALRSDTYYSLGIKWGEGEKVEMCSTSFQY